MCSAHYYYYYYYYYYYHHLNLKKIIRDQLIFDVLLCPEASPSATCITVAKCCLQSRWYSHWQHNLIPIRCTHFLTLWIVLLTLWRLTTYIYIRRTAQLTSRRCILNIYSTNILIDYFKHAAHSPFFSLFKMPFIS